MDDPQTSDPMVIQSHGPYTATFDMDAFDELNASVPDNAHFLVDGHVANLYADTIPTC